MLNRKTILQLYNCEVYPAEHIVPTSPKYKNLVEEFRDVFEAKSSQELDVTFCYGFALGLRLLQRL